MDVEVPSWDEFQAVKDSTITEGYINGAGNLVLKNLVGAEFNAGHVIQDIFTRKVQIYDAQNAAGGTVWTKPVGAKNVRVILIGGGCGGGGSTSGFSGPGGALIDVTMSASKFGNTETVTVTGGGVGASGGNKGTSGGYAKITYSGESITAAGGNSSGAPGQPTRDGEQIQPGPNFQPGNEVGDSGPPGISGGGGAGQKPNDGTQISGTPGFYGFTKSGFGGGPPGNLGHDGDAVNGIPGGGGGIPGAQTPGHGGYPGGGGSQGLGATPGGNGGGAVAVIITYFTYDKP